MKTVDGCSRAGLELAFLQSQKLERGKSNADENEDRRNVNNLICFSFEASFRCKEKNSSLLRGKYNRV
jgi:hypothetical protein